MDIIYKELSPKDLNKDLLGDFNRYQKVTSEWVPIKKGAYILKEQPHIEDWDQEYKERKVITLLALLERGGKLFGAYDGDKLVGFSAIDGVLLGSDNQYIELKQLHVSCEYRGKHIGTELFKLCAKAAKTLEAKKLYIVASSAKESQDAYGKLGCVYTTEIIPKLYDESSPGVHLEYTL